MPRNKQITQTYNDGMCRICEVTNIADPGEMPKDGLKEKIKLRFEERTVGMSRFWSAMQDHARIDMLIRTQRIRGVNNFDIVVLQDGEQYQIRQIQYPRDVEPPSMDLSLTRLETKYSIGGDDR